MVMAMAGALLSFHALSAPPAYLTRRHGAEFDVEDARAGQEQIPCCWPFQHAAAGELFVLLGSGVGPFQRASAGELLGGGGGRSVGWFSMAWPGP